MANALGDKTEGTVVFQSKPLETFRFAVEIKEDRGRIWLENKRSKQQWECKIDEVADYAPEGVAIPRDVVLMCAQANFESGNPKTVDLVRKGEDDTLHLSVVLSLGTPGDRRRVVNWVYWFPMKLRALDRVDVLESEMRDLREGVEMRQDAKPCKSVAVVTPPGQLGAGLFALHVHRIQPTFASAKCRDEQKRLSMTFVAGGGETCTDYMIPGEEIEQTWFLVVRDAPNNNELSIKIVREHCAQPLAVGKLMLSDFGCGFHERKMTFRFGPTASRTMMEVFFCGVWFPGARVGDIRELSCSS